MRVALLLIPALAAAAMLAGCGKPAPAERKLSVAADFAFKPVSIALPAETAALPEAAAAVTQNCSGCHSVEMITAQPPLDAAKWQAEIDKMRKVFKAPVDPADDKTLIAALMALPGQAPAN